MTNLNYKHATNKVGFIPYRYVEKKGEQQLQFMVYLPDAKKDPNDTSKAKNGQPIEYERKTIKWGVARGTVRYEDEKSSGARDIRDAAELPNLDTRYIEDHRVTMQREAYEELGIMSADIMESTIYDHGLKHYISEEKPSYDVHFYSFQVEQNANTSLQVLKSRADDAQDIAWKTFDEVKEMAYQHPQAIQSGPNQQFKEGYLSIIQEIAKELPQQKSEGNGMAL